MPLRSPLNLLFLCTGNACRSQMAEGWARHYGAGQVKVESAGIEAHGQDPRAVSVMLEAGVDISGQTSRRVTPPMLERAHIVVTVCGDADELCPVLPPGVHKEHWPLRDPARAQGTEDAIETTFRDSRDEIRRRVCGLLQRVKSGHFDA